MPDARRVIIAEGDAVLSQRAAAHFREAGWAPILVRDAMHALSAAKEMRPAVIVLNSALPGGGMHALSRLKSNINTAAIPVVTITELPEVYLRAGSQKCAASMGDLGTVEQAAAACCASPAPVKQAAAPVIEDSARLDAVTKTGMLDTPPEPTLDAVTRLTARLLDVPTALVTLVDKDRQFFKSQVGLKPPWSTERQTRLSHSFCQWVVSGQEPMAIEDARSHPVLSANLAIRDLGVIAYLGVPLEAQGQAVGSFCAINPAPRPWSDRDMRLLRELACVVKTFTLLPNGAGTQALDTAARALTAIASVTNDGGNRLEKTEAELLRQIVNRLGRQLASLPVP